MKLGIHKSYFLLVMTFNIKSKNWLHYQIALADISISF